MDTELSFEDSIGQQLVISFEGPVIDRHCSEAITRFKVPNILISCRNITGRQQLTQLCSSLRENIEQNLNTSALLFLQYDESCAQVLSPFMTVPPSPLALQAIQDESSAYTAAAIFSAQLKQVGIDAIIGPSLNINTDRRNRELGLFSFGDTPETVSRFASSMTRGYIDGGILPVCYAFPGAGQLYSDENHTVEQNDKTLDELMECELAPFVKIIENGNSALMCAPAYYSAFDEEKTISSMSVPLVQNLLRETLGYSSVLFSPVIDLPNISNSFPIETVAVESLKTGCDFLILSHRHDHLEKIHSSIAEAIESSYIPHETRLGSQRRIASLKKQLKERKDFEKPSEAAPLIVSAMVERSITVIQNNEDLPFELGSFPIFLGRNTGSNSFAKWMYDHIGGEYFEFSESIDNDELHRLMEEVSDNSSIVIAIKDGHLFETQLSMANALGATGIPTMAVSLHNPYDLLFLNPSIYSIAAFEDCERSFEAVRKVLTHERIATGTVSIHW